MLVSNPTETNTSGRSAITSIALVLNSSSTIHLLTGSVNSIGELVEVPKASVGRLTGATARLQEIQDCFPWSCSQVVLPQSKMSYMD